MRRDDRAYFFDILESAYAIREYLNGVTAESLEHDQLKQDAIIRRIAIIGEAAKHITDQAKSRWPQVPYDAMYAMRNMIVHQYFDVDFEEVWKAASESVPELIAALEPIMREIEDEFGP